VSAVFYLAGAEFLAEEALARIREQVGADPLAEETFDAASEPGEIASALETPPLLGGTRLVIVRDADSLKKAHIEALNPFIAEPPPDAVLVLLGTARSKLLGQVKKTGEVITLDAPKGRRLVSWVRNRARERKLALDERATWTLIDAVGNELRDLDGALEQLSTGLGTGAKVSAAHVRRAFPRLADERIYAFTDAVGERKLSSSVALLRRLLEQGDEPLMLFGALAAHVRRMLAARRVADRGPGALGDALGLPQWRAERLHRQIRSYKEDELVAAMSVLAETDIEMKGGDVPPEVALERAVIQIVSPIL